MSQTEILSTAPRWSDIKMALSILLRAQGVGSKGYKHSPYVFLNEGFLDMSFGTSPKKKNGGLRPFYGDTEAAVSARMSYLDDYTLTSYKQQAHQDVEEFQHMFAEAGIRADHELTDHQDLLIWGGRTGIDHV
jgi:hypothetical protein